MGIKSRTEEEALAMPLMVRIMMRARAVEERIRERNRAMVGGLNCLCCVLCRSMLDSKLEMYEFKLGS